MKGYSITLIFLVLVSINICAQIELPAEELEKITSPRYIQRTMNLLQTSTPEQRNTVRILIYGQSLSAQDWWLDVKQYFEKQFPHADLIMNNKSIGGFSSQFLTKTVKRDILDYYPDLVIFHVFGSDHFYEQVLLQMRSLTSTEILIWNDPQNKTEPNEWHEEMSYKIIPSFAVKYKCMLIDVRTPINKFIKEKNLNYADEFTRDGLHFNDKGCKLLASNIIPHLVYDSKFEPDPDNFDLLVKNVATTMCSNVTPVPAAASDVLGQVGTQFDYGKTSLTTSGEIPATPIDMIEGLPRIDFVKIDVEGMELKVLNGMRQTIASYKPQMLIEMQDPTTYAKTYDFLNGFGYNIYWLPVRTYTEFNHKNNKEDVFGAQHGVINWIASTADLSVKLSRVVDRDDTVERMVYRRSQNG